MLVVKLVGVTSPDVELISSEWVPRFHPGVSTGVVICGLVLFSGTGPVLVANLVVEAFSEERVVSSCVASLINHSFHARIVIFQA